MPRQPLWAIVLCLSCLALPCAAAESLLPPLAPVAAPQPSVPAPPQPTAAPAPHPTPPADPPLLTPAPAGAQEDAINFGDQVVIEVFKQPDLRFEGVVPPSGQVMFPMIGQLQVQGRSSQAVANAVAAALKREEFVTNPFVVVQITALAPTYVYIRGAVAKPAAIPLPVGQPMRLTQLLAAAGGTLEEVAVKQKVQIIHYGSDRQPAGQQVVDLAQLEAAYDFALDPVLQSGDEVFVPRKLIPRVIVIGAVTNPQTVAIADGRKLTVSEAIAQCGGLRDEADNATVQLQLASSTSPQSLLTLDMKEILSGRKPDIELSDGDRIYVPTVDGIVVSGRVKEPGVVYARPGVKMTVTRALSMSGGFISYASRNEVYVIRKGSLKPIQVDVGNILKTGDLSNDQELSPGDVVIVPEGIW